MRLHKCGCKHGMSYSLASRNLLSDLVVNQMEAQCYHAAIVLSGCDKSPFGLVNGLANLDLTRQNRGDLPVHATFVPSHVLKGGTIPPAITKETGGASCQSKKKGTRTLLTTWRTQ